MERDGLYIRMGKDGKIARTLVSHGEKQKFKNTTVQDELILFSELNFEYYVEFLQGFGEIGNELLKDLENETEVNMKMYMLFYNMAYNLCDVIEEENPIWVHSQEQCLMIIFLLITARTISMMKQ